MLTCKQCEPCRASRRGPAGCCFKNASAARCRPCDEGRRNCHFGPTTVNGELLLSAGNNAYYVLACWNGEGYVFNPRLSLADQHRAATILVGLPPRHFSAQDIPACRGAVRYYFGGRHVDMAKWPYGFRPPPGWAPPQFLPDGVEPGPFDVDYNHVPELDFADRLEAIRREANSELIQALHSLSVYARLAEQESRLTGETYGALIITTHGEQDSTRPLVLADVARHWPEENEHRQLLLELLRTLERAPPRNYVPVTRPREEADVFGGRARSRSPGSAGPSSRVAPAALVDSPIQSEEGAQDASLFGRPRLFLSSGSDAADAAHVVESLSAGAASAGPSGSRRSPLALAAEPMDVVEDSQEQPEAGPSA